MSQVERLTRDGVVAIVRLDDLSAAVALTEALIAGGVTTIEFTYTNPLAGQVISEVRSAVGDRAAIGAGTVLDPETARLAILAGAEFIVTPALRPATIELCRRYSIPAVVGAFTPTEILTAWEAGADIVKVFPASVGGPRYLKDVKGPLPHIKLIPTGGVSVDTAADFIKAGAEAIAAGSNLVDAKSVANADWNTITNRARELATIVASARSGQ
jgi:2-dehydro-3-deoxyphosphogluconate aldolase/(4S)-4-hydroxy-2-oxoglutarate aldolase